MDTSSHRPEAEPNRKERSGRNKIWLFTCICLLLFLLLLEAGLQIAAFLRPLSFLLPNQDRYWETIFLRRNAPKKHLSMAHETRGWTPKPGKSAGGEGHRITINDAGYRSPQKHHVLREDKYRVVALGDSFTFGWGSDDSGTWPQLLEEMDPRLQVINLGVGSYGLDQMYITLRETIEIYRPHLVIAAYIGDDLFRSLLGFRDYRKPKFILEENELLLTNTPIGSLEETRARLEKKSYPPRFMIGVALKLLYAGLFERDRDIIFPNRESEVLCRKLNSRLLEEMMEIARMNKSDFLLAHLAEGRSVREKEFTDYGEEFLFDFISDHQVNWVTTREEFLKGRGWGEGHYGGREAGLVARQIYGKLKNLPSFEEFARRNPEEPGQSW